MSIVGRLACFLGLHSWQKFTIVFERRRCRRCKRQQIFGFGRWHTEHQDRPRVIESNIFDGPWTIGDEYRTLEKGEIIQEGDEIDACRDGWRDGAVWKPVTSCIGEPAPDPAYPSHRVYRRKIRS